MTRVEIDFVLEETGILPGARVLDMGCGTGRHSVELAKRGYRVTGVEVDLDEMEIMLVARRA